MNTWFMNEVDYLNHYKANPVPCGELPMYHKNEGLDYLSTVENNPKKPGILLKALPGFRRLLKRPGYLSDITEVKTP